MISFFLSHEKCFASIAIITGFATFHIIIGIPPLFLLLLCLCHSLLIVYYFCYGQLFFFFQLYGCCHCPFLKKTKFVAVTFEIGNMVVTVVVATVVITSNSVFHHHHHYPYCSLRFRLLPSIIKSHCMNSGDFFGATAGYSMSGIPMSFPIFPTVLTVWDGRSSLPHFRY